MIPILILFLSIFVFRGLGAVGVPVFSTWDAATRYALALMFFATASAHFTPMRQDLIRMVPRQIPYPEQVVFITGVLELLGAVGILVPSLQQVTGALLIVFLIAVFPANIHACQHNVLLNNQPATPLWLRLPIQMIFIGLTYWSTLAVQAPTS